MSRRPKSKHSSSSQGNAHGLLTDLDGLGAPSAQRTDNVEHIDDLKQAPHAPLDDDDDVDNPASTAALSPPANDSNAPLRPAAAGAGAGANEVSEGGRATDERSPDSTAATTGSPSEDVRFHPLNASQHRYHVTERPYTTTVETPTTTTTTFHRSVPSPDDSSAAGTNAAGDAALPSSAAGTGAAGVGAGAGARRGGTPSGAVSIDLQPYPARPHYPGGAAVAAATAAAAGSGRAYRAHGFRDGTGAGHGAGAGTGAGAGGASYAEAADEYEWEDIQEVRTPRDALGQYKKEIATVIFLLIVGVVCTSVGISRLTAADSDGGVVLLIVGGLTLIPGVYYAVKFGIAYRSGTPFSLLIMPTN